MLELLVLGQIPGTTTQLSISAVLNIIFVVALIVAGYIYNSVHRRRLWQLQRQLLAIELYSL
jgi:hypothetical protein